MVSGGRRVVRKQKFFDIVFFSISIYIFFLLAERFLAPDEAAVSAAVFMCVPMFMFAGTFFLPDYALILFWLAALLYFKKITERPALGGWIIFEAEIHVLVVEVNDLGTDRDHTGKHGPHPGPQPPECNLNLFDHDADTGYAHRPQRRPSGDHSHPG